MKNVTGYDLVKFLAGSYGTLAVLTEVTFKVLPAPETEATLVLAGLDDARGRRGAVGGARLALLGHRRGAPPGGRRRAGADLLRLEGFADSVADRAGACATQLGRLRRRRPCSTRRSRSRLWQAIRDLDALGARRPERRSGASR